MGSILPVWRIFARRGLSNWRLLAALALGVVIAATLLASAPIYARAMADLGLTFVIREDLQANPSTHVEFRAVPLQTEDGLAFRAAVERRIDERIGWFRASQSRYVKVGRFVATRPGETEAPNTPLGQLQSVSGVDSHVRLVEGRLPQATAPVAPMEIAMSGTAAQVLHLVPGDELQLGEDFDTCERELPRDDAPPPPACNPLGSLRFTFSARLVGLVEPIDPDESFWVFGADAYFKPARLVTASGPSLVIPPDEDRLVLPMFTDEATLLNAFGSLHPGYRAYTAWNVFANPDRLSRTNFERARDDIHALYTEFEPLGGFAYSPLTSTLDGFGRSARYEQVPLTILLLEIAGVALFYVVLMAAVLVERQAGEITLLRSRGATTFQVAALYLFEGLVVGIPALLAAPFIAAASTALLGLTPVFDNVTDGSLLPVTVPLLSFGMAAIGMVLSLLALVVPAFVVARRSAVAQRRAESRPGASILQRYYLDLGLAGIAGLLLWELRERGSVFTPSATGGVSSDPILLASPALIIAAAAALTLRFYPMLLRVAARLFAAAAGVTVAVGLWQVVRSPGQYTRLTLLLMMAVAVGTFAASYSSTADRSYRDRAFYAAGVDWRASTNSATNTLGSSGAQVDADLRKLPGVVDASSLMRTSGYLATPGQSTKSIQILGINPEAGRDMLWFRDDFADRPFGSLMSQLGGPGELPGLVLPGDPAQLSLWVNSGQTRDQTTLWARVRDAHDQYDLLEFGLLDSTGWRELRASVKRSAGPTLVPPISLVSFVLTEPANRFIQATAPVFIDDLSAVSVAGQATLVEGFEGPSHWATMPNRAVTQDQFSVATDQPHSGRSSGKLVLRSGLSTEVRGLYYMDENVPLPVIASDAFAASTGIGRGVTGIIQVGSIAVPILVKDTYHLFPTLQTSEGPSIVFNRDHLTSWLNLVPTAGTPELNEAWFTLAPDADRSQLAAALKSPEFGLNAVHDRREDLASIEHNPLIAAGGSGILFLAFLAVLVLVAAALLVSLWVAVQRRRTEFAVLRALGLSRGQVFRLLAFEYSLVATVGLATGVYLGLLVGRRMLSFLDVTESGQKVEPGFILQTEWAVVAGGAVAVLIVFGAALLLAVRLLSRISDAQALRIE